MKKVDITQSIAGAIDSSKRRQIWGSILWRAFGFNFDAAWRDVEVVIAPVRQV